jgi:hypothetical protein
MALWVVLLDEITRVPFLNLIGSLYLLIQLTAIANKSVQSWCRNAATLREALVAEEFPDLPVHTVPYLLN